MCPVQNTYTYFNVHDEQKVGIEKKTGECYKLQHLDYTVVADTGTQPLFSQEELHKHLSEYIDLQTVLSIVVLYSCTKYLYTNV